MWEWSIPDIYADIIHRNYFFGDRSLAEMMQEIARSNDGIPNAGAHQLYEDVYLVRVNSYLLIYERMPEPRLLIVSDLRELDELIASMIE